MSADRARGLLARPHGWIEPAPGGGYAVRTGVDRRARVRLIVGEAEFRALVDEPGLTPRPGGGWKARRGDVRPAAPPPGRPGLIAGCRELIDGDGRMHSHPANLAGSAIAWLAGRRDSSGAPWVTPAERAAAERLELEAEVALAGPSLTMRWDALPRSGGGSASRFEPGDRAMSAARRVEAALAARGPARRR
ncbi:MAG: hypothetical protein IR159_10745, partial [Brevundimonas sp.]|nr:hypothetical protein [Brevundimonas sp.]